MRLPGCPHRHHLDPLIDASARGSLGSTAMTLETNEAEAEDIIRSYLLYVKDPKELLDGELIAKAEAVLADATDPIDILKAHAELKRVTEVDPEPLRQGFVANAKAWAEQQGVPLTAFRELEVPDDVLREAGFDVPATKRRGRSSTTSGEGQQRARAVPVAELKEFILKQEGTFVLIDIMNGLGGSPATVRKAVDELIDGDQVTKLGPDPDWQGAGRAPMLYQTTSN